MTSKREREILKRIEVLERDPVEAKLEEANNTIDKFFELYEQAHEWINNAHESGRDGLYVENMFGGRRHLYGYISASPAVWAAMDRRSPNSLIQGPLSQVGYIGIYAFERWLDDLTRATGLPLIQHIGVYNQVHDAGEAEAPILLLPLASYMFDHAFTTCVADYLAEHNIPQNVEFEVEQEIGLNMAETRKHDGHRRTMISSMEPLARTKRERRQLLENIDAIMTIREKEVKLDLRDYEKKDRKPSRRRLLTPDDVAALHMPDFIKPKPRHKL